MSQARIMSIALGNHMASFEKAVENKTRDEKIAFYRTVIESTEPLGENGLGPAIAARSRRAIEQIEMLEKP
jgi:hypothetical protein